MVPYIALMLFSLLLTLPGALFLPVVDRDEAHFAQASRQMVQTGHFFQIRFQDKTRFQKPPGINWLQAASVKVLGDANRPEIWPYRVPSVLGALLSVWLTYALGRRWLSTKDAMIAAALLALSVLFIIEADMAVIDASLLCAVVWMQWALWHMYERRLDGLCSLFWPCMFWMAMTFGFVLKGVTPLVGGLSLVFLCLFDKRLILLKQVRLPLGLFLFLGLTLWWLYLVNEAEQSNYLLKMLQKDLLPKLQGGHESHGKPPLFHLLLLPVTFWPSSLFLWPAAAYAFANRHTQAVTFLLAWILPTWVFFELMPTKLPQYVLPTFPAIALLAAMAIRDARTSFTSTRWLKTLQIGWLILSVAIIGAVALVPYMLQHTLSVLSVFFIVLGTVFSSAAFYKAWKGEYTRALLPLCACALLFYPMVLGWMLPSQTPLWLTKTVAMQSERGAFTPQAPLAVSGFEEPSLVFYLNTYGVRVMDIPHIAAYLAQSPAHRALIPASQWVALQNHSKRTHYSAIATIRGLYYSKGRWIDLMLVNAQQGEQPS